MRLSQEDIAGIREQVARTAGVSASVVLFGSRLDDTARGGDVDLLVEVPQAVARPAQLSAQLAGRISRALNGRHVDIVLSAPNLKDQSIHLVARTTGIRL